MKQGKPGVYARYIKRILDVLLSGCALVVLTPVLLIVAVLVRTKLGSPIIFCQERPGKDEKIFKMYKFRSMYQDAEERKKELMAMNTMKGFMFKADNDPRIIGSGKDGSKHGIGWFIPPEICLRNYKGSITPLFFQDGSPFIRTSHILYKSHYFELPQVRAFIQTVLAEEYFNA